MTEHAGENTNDDNAARTGIERDTGLRDQTETTNSDVVTKDQSEAEAMQCDEPAVTDNNAVVRIKPEPETVQCDRSEVVNNVSTVVKAEPEAAPSEPSEVIGTTPTVVEQFDKPEAKDATPNAVEKLEEPEVIYVASSTVNHYNTAGKCDESSKVMDDETAAVDADSLALLCGQPAVSDDRSVSLTSEVTNTLRRKSVAYEFVNKSLYQTVMNNESDLKVAAACEALLASFDPCDNVASGLGARFTSVSVSCEPSASLQVPHPPCDHKSKCLNAKTLSKIYRCVLCKHIERSMELLLEHQKMAHVGATATKKLPRLIKSNCSSCSRSHILGKYSCKNCIFTTTCPFVLEVHMKDSHDSEQMYHCPCCRHSTRYYTAMETHLFEKHWSADSAQKGKKAKQPSVNGEGPAEPDQVVEVDTFERPIAPEVCVEALPDEPLLCALCLGRFKALPAFRFHLKNKHFNSHGNMFQCCSFDRSVFTTYAGLISHYKETHAPIHSLILQATRFKGCEFGSDDHLDRIVTKASEKFVYAIDEFTYRSPLFHEIRSQIFRRKAIEKEVNRMECAQIPQIFMKCNLCTYGPVGKHLMISHLRKHTQNWPFSCPGCQQWFKKKDLALVHARHCNAPSKNLTNSTFRVIIKMEFLKKQNEGVINLLMEHCSIKMQADGNAALPTLEEFRMLFTLVEFWCDLCKFNCDTFDEMVTHMEEHCSVVELVQCKDCHLDFANMSTFYAHTQNTKCPGSKCQNVLRNQAGGSKCAKGKDAAVERAIYKVTLVEFSPSQVAIAQLYSDLLDKHPGKSVEKVVGSSSDKTTDNVVLGFQCRCCLKCFTEMTEIKPHVARHLSYVPWRCSWCSVAFKVYAGEGGFYEHVRQKHPGSEPNACKFVDLGAFSKQERKIESSIANVKVFVDKIGSIRGKAPATAPLTVEDGNSAVAVAKRNDTPQKRVDKRKQSLDSTTYQEQAQPLASGAPAKKARYFEPSVLLQQENINQSAVNTSDVLEQRVTHTQRHRDSVTQKKADAEAARISKAAICSFICPQCKDFEGTWPDLLVHYEAMHSDMAVCPKCVNSPCFHLVDFYKHMKKHDPMFKASNVSARRSDKKILARDLVEQLGKVSRQKFGSMPATTCVKSKIITVKLLPGGGLASARFVCKQCSLSCRNMENFFKHIAEHLNIGEFHCLHCNHEANMDEMREHYRDRHHNRIPEILPNSLQHKRYRKLVESIMHKLERDGEDADDQANENTDDSVATAPENRDSSIAEASSSGDVSGNQKEDEKAGGDGAKDRENAGVDSNAKSKEGEVGHSVKTENAESGVQDTSKKTTVRIKTEPKDPGYGDQLAAANVKLEAVDPPDEQQEDAEDESQEEEETLPWSFCFSCPYCEMETDDKVSQHITHVEINHPRKQMAIGISLDLSLSEANALTIAEKAHNCLYNRPRHTGRRDKSVVLSLSPAYRKSSAMTCAPPKGFHLEDISTSELIHEYNAGMLSLYNHFSILEVVSIVGGTMTCHMCNVAQETFPALFEHWSRHHLTIEPYVCAFCGIRARRPATLISHERRLHARDAGCGSKYGINREYLDDLFSTLVDVLNIWLKRNKVNSFIPEDMNLVKEPVVRLQDISKDPAFQTYFRAPSPRAASPASSVTSLRSTRSRRPRR